MNVTLTIGIDEVGRGCLAGPVWAAAVALPDDAELRSRMRDSKAISARRREALAAEILLCGRTGLGMATVEEIDGLNIRRATHLAMTRALDALKPESTFALVIDGNDMPDSFRGMDARCVVGADAIHPEVSAASIVAKVGRDALMRELAILWPAYGWERNAGYGTAEHRAAIKKAGVSPWHRKSFSMGI